MVFRTTDGLTTPWAGWKNDKPAGRTQDSPGVMDCITRRFEDGLWEDYGCAEDLEYYCEGCYRPHNLKYSTAKYLLLASL